MTAGAGVRTPRPFRRRVLASSCIFLRLRKFDHYKIFPYNKKLSIMRFENTVELLTVVKIVENYNLVLNYGLIQVMSFYPSLFHTCNRPHRLCICVHTVHLNTTDILCISSLSLVYYFSNTLSPLYTGRTTVRRRIHRAGE